MKVSRRQVLQWMSAAAAAGVVVSCGPEAVPEPDIVAAVAGTALPIPPLIDDNGTGIGLVAAAATTEFVPGAPTETWGFNQPFLGPTIRVRTGAQAAITVENRLDEDITAHWHGLEVPGIYDGGPMNLIAPGDTWAPTISIEQPASTCWYHSHVHGQTGRQVYRGLAGLFYIDDENSDSLGLPSDYGVDDIPVIIMDRNFTATGELDYNLMGSAGGLVFLGGTILVNGVIDPYVEVSAALVRLRLLNAAHGRSFDLSLDDGSLMTLIAADGGFMNTPAEVETVLLRNGQRREVLLDLSGYNDGDEIILRSRNLDNDGGTLADNYEVLRIRIVGTPTGDVSIRSVMNDNLSAVELAAATTVVAERSFALRGGPGGINGEVFEHGVINEAVQLNTWERWSASGQHPFHVHGASFFVISRDGDLRPEDSAWQDTVWAGDNPEFLIRFRHEAPAMAPYMYHCHIFGHEDAGMMGQFTVT